MWEKRKNSLTTNRLLAADEAKVNKKVGEDGRRVAVGKRSQKNIQPLKTNGHSAADLEVPGKRRKRKRITDAGHLGSHLCAEDCWGPFAIHLPYNDVERLLGNTKLCFYGRLGFG